MSSVKRPQSPFDKWSMKQAESFIKDCVRCGDSQYFLIQDPHAYQRMELRGFDLTEVYEVILKGKCTKDEMHDMKHRDRRLTFTLERRSTGERHAVVAINDEDILPGCILITVF